MPHERMFIQESRVRAPRAETAYRRTSMLGVLSHAATAKFGVDVNTDRPMQLAAELVRFRSAWRKQHGPGPLDGLKIKALTDKVRIVREALSEPEPEVEF
jgi:hypothetical protein